MLGQYVWYSFRVSACIDNAGKKCGPDATIEAIVSENGCEYAKQLSSIGIDF